VTAKYPGANSRIIVETVAAQIEQQVVGVENMLCMSSQSNNDASSTLDVTFVLGTDVNMAQVLVQNRVATAEPTLPDVFLTIGVSVKKRSPDILLVVDLDIRGRAGDRLSSLRHALPEKLREHQSPGCTGPGGGVGESLLIRRARLQRA